MNSFLHNVVTLFETVAHPAGGKMTIPKRKRNTVVTFNSKATPDSQNIRDLVKRQDSFRRNPAP